jgi:S-adenosylmethionine synthetase
MRYLDPDKHLRIHSRIRPGSAELVELFLRQRKAGDWAANDTSFGSGFAPFTPLETLVLRLERELRSAEALRAHPERGEDIKVMAVRHDAHVAITLADAFVGRGVPTLQAYRELREALREDARACAQGAEIAVNACDDLDSGSIYLTVTGTSAEAGDDGQAGRGNRASGLITPYRPMSMESVAGKNPVSHVGKIYNVAAFRISDALVRRVDGLRGVSCQLVSRIGGKVRDPQMVHLRCWLEPSAGMADLERDIQNIVAEQLAALDHLYEDFLAHRICIA